MSVFILTIRMETYLKSRDDDDEFLYGGAPVSELERPTAVPDSTPEATAQSSNGLIHDLEPQTEALPGGLSNKAGATVEREEEEEEVELGDETEEEVEEEEEEEDDIEIIMDQPARSLDFRQSSASRPPTNRVTSISQPAQPKVPQPSLTTEYTPIQRGGTYATPSKAPTSQSQSVPASSTQQMTPSSALQSTQNQPHQTSEPPRDENGVDSSSLPPVTAPLSHPTIDPNAVGVFDGRSILEVDLGAMSEKPWRKPGSDISDWFNYGFDELSWEAYCYRRRELGEVANVLKANVLTFSGMPEDQLTALPPEVRQMVMTGTSAMMNNAGANGGMMGPGVMMDMSGMMGPMSMGMNGDMSMGGAMMPMGLDGRGMMQVQDNSQVQSGSVGIGGNGTPEHLGNTVSMMQDGFNGSGSSGMMNMGIAGDFGMQDQNQIGQQIYQNMEAPTNPTPAPPAPRAPAAVPYRGRGINQGVRGRGFPGRGRGRGGIYTSDGVPPPVAVRPASPLPPGVPTGPRNQNKYKDRDGNAPAVDGLDYGGNVKDIGGRTPSGEPEDRSSRKRRISPGPDEGRGPKRR